MSQQETVAVQQQQDRVLIWKYKKQLMELQEARGNGTSMITLLIAPKTSISQVTQQMNERLSSANRIKSSV